MEKQALANYTIGPLVTTSLGHHDSIIRFATENKLNELRVIKYYERNPAEIYNSYSKKLIAREVEMLTKCRHPGVVAFFEHGEGLIKVEDKMFWAYFIVYEYLEGGTLFDIITRHSLDESIIRFIFSELAKIMSFLFSVGVCHLDIKLENIMFDKEGKMRLIDFGFACEAVLPPPKNNGKLDCFVGTPNYQCPEINEGKHFSGFAADVFSLGVVLFSLAWKSFPFNKAQLEDYYYNAIAKGSYRKYWEILSSMLPIEGYSTDLRMLVTGLLIYPTVSRLTLPELLGHSWFTGYPMMSEAEGRAKIKSLFAH